jgi:hypothetical protein
MTAAQQPAGQPSFRTTIDVVSMSVTVTDPTHRYVTNLTQDDFEIFEDGVKQELTLFNRTNLPVALSLLIDTSSSMKDRMMSAQDAAIGFIRKLRPTDLGEVIGFDSRAESPAIPAAPPISNRRLKTVAGGSTSITPYTHLAEGHEAPHGEDEIDGRSSCCRTADTSSLVTFDDVWTCSAPRRPSAIGLMRSRRAGTEGFRGAAAPPATTDTGGRVFSRHQSLSSVYGRS